MLPKGFRHSQETIKKMRTAALKRRPRTEVENRQHGQKIQEWLKDPRNHPMYGKKHTLESREKMRIAHLGKWIGKNSSNFGLKRSPELREKLSLIPHPRGKDHPRWGHTHTSEAREKIRQANSREKSHRWRGGIIRSGGYIYIMSPDHPFRTRMKQSLTVTGYVAAHRLIVESYLKRFLKRSESVHHINKIKSDNRPENLMAFAKPGAHLAFEYGKPAKPGDIIFDGRLLKH